MTYELIARLKAALEHPSTMRPGDVSELLEDSQDWLEDNTPRPRKAAPQDTVAN